MNAAIAVAIVPIILFAMVFRKYLVRGLTIGNIRPQGVVQDTKTTTKELIRAEAYVTQPMVFKVIFDLKVCDESSRPLGTLESALEMRCG